MPTCRLSHTSGIFRVADHIQMRRVTSPCYPRDNEVFGREIADELLDKNTRPRAPLGKDYGGAEVGLSGGRSNPGGNAARD